MAVRQELEQYKGVWVRPGTSDHAVVDEMRSSYGSLNYNGARVLDIGAHIGCFARFAIAQGAEYVMAYEPDPDNYAVLRKNLPPNANSTEAAIVPTSFPAVQATTELWRVDTPSGHYRHSIIERRGRTPIRVFVKNWKNVVGYFRPSLLKMDIEGGEYLFMDELANLPHFVRQLALELQLDRKEWRMKDAPAIIQGLERQGFKPIKVENIEKAQSAMVGTWAR